MAQTKLNALSLDPKDTVYMVEHPQTGIILLYNGGEDNPIVPRSNRLILSDCRETKGKLTISFLKAKKGG